MTDLLQILKNARQLGRPVFWDGAMGTQLIAAGLAGKVPELWNLEKPETIGAIHQAYVDAGADVIQVNSFGANRPKLKTAGLESRLLEINRSAVEVAKKAAAGKALVAGDFGPTGEMMDPMGSLTPEKAEEIYAEQARVLARAGVDLFSIETMFDLAEIAAAVRVLKKAAPKIPVVAQMTFKKTGRGFFTMMGVSPAQAVEGLLSAGADVVGANCSIGPEKMVELVKIFRSLTKAPVIAQANAGEPKMEGGKEIYEYTPEQYAVFAPEMFNAGADAIGACCGSSPEFIRRMVSKFPKK
jgi:5-methyltetrahydrofolate--homocysteine methyltransferase